MVVAAVGAAVGGGIGLATGGGFKGALEGAALGGVGGWAGSGLIGGVAADGLSGAGASALTGAEAAASAGTGAEGSALLGGFSNTGLLSGGLGSFLSSNPGSYVGLGGQIFNAAGQVIGSQAAANAQTSANQNAIQAQQGFFNTANQNLQPFIQTGTAASAKIAGLEGLPGGDGSTIQQTLQTLPGYQFALGQGLKNTQNSATSRGLGLSGQAVREADQYATGLADSNYSNYLTGLQNTANTGAGAAGTLTGAATNTGQQIGQSLTNIGTAQGAADVASGRALGGVGNTYSYGQIANNLFQN